MFAPNHHNNSPKFSDNFFGCFPRRCNAAAAVVVHDDDDGGGGGGSVAVAVVCWRHSLMFYPVINKEKRKISV